MGKRNKMARSKTVVTRPRCCWGAQIQRISAEWCSPKFVPGARHFKTKFCPTCKLEMAVPVERVCALNDRLQRLVRNNHQGGLWTELPNCLGGGRYRVINHNKSCIGPPLVIFEYPPPDMDWPPVPKSWVSDDAHVHLFVSKGTLVPTGLRRVQLAQVIVPSALMNIAMPSPIDEEYVPPPILVAEDAREEEEEEHEEEDEEELAEEVLEVEAQDEHFALAPLSAFGNDSPSSSSDGASVVSSPTPVDAMTEKRMTRMMRNRQSAAASRERKREYIATLEGQVHELSNQVKKLCEENSLLRAANLCPDENALWSAVLNSQQY